MLSSLKQAILGNAKNPKCNSWFSLQKRINRIQSDNEHILNQRWFLDSFVDLNVQYIKSFKLLKGEKFQNAWDGIINCENIIHFLRRNWFIDDFKHEIDIAEKFITQHQELFPYNMFGSMGAVIQEKKCSICDKNKLSINNACSHIKGRVYSGKLCCYVITKLELKELSLTHNPDDKRCIMHMQDKEYDYSLLKNLVSKLDNPFQKWSFEWSKIPKHHSEFKQLNPNSDLCPCGSSKTYKDCCLGMEFILGNHIQFLIGKNIK